MNIPENITKEHIVRAIDEINVSDIPDSRRSRNYFFNLGGKILPPKYVISEANKYANRVVLNSESFNAEQAVAFLEKLGFEIEKSNSEAEVKKEFLKYMSQSHKNYSTSKEYVKYMSKIEKWLSENQIASKNFSIWEDVEEIDTIEQRLNSDFKEKWKKKNKDEKNWYGSPWNMWVRFNKESILENRDLNNIRQIDFGKDKFLSFISKSGLFFVELTITRFLASLLAKPFLILTGLSGSGKTKLAQAFVQWICQDKDQYCIVPVGADWTNREPLLGYPNALKFGEYVKPDNGVLDLVINANNHPEIPYFLILDEMNLSHVERYFADFLSVMESKDKIPLYDENTVERGVPLHDEKPNEKDVPPKLSLPNNLFIIGTVNIDETTNMFSPKVLDRANTIEFRVTSGDMEKFLGNIKDVDMTVLNSKGAAMAKNFLQMAENKIFVTESAPEINETLLRFFNQLKKGGAEFGYRSAAEILRLMHQLTVLDDSLSMDEKLDVAIMQKLLPKLHGSRRKLCPILETLGSFCIDGDLKIVKEVFENEDFDFEGSNVIYSLSLEKISRMYRGAIDNGFTSFAEA